MDEAQLVQGLLTQDPGTVQELVVANGDRLFRSACLLCGNEAEAQDLVQETFLQAVRSARNRARALELKLVNAALRRIEAEPDDFGLCASCEEPIAGARLDVAPWVERCVDCQAKLDQIRGQPRRHAGDFVD